MNIYRWCLSPSQGRVLIQLGDSRACLEGILGGEEEQTQHEMQPEVLLKWKS